MRLELPLYTTECTPSFLSFRTHVGSFLKIQCLTGFPKFSIVCSARPIVSSKIPFAIGRLDCRCSHGPNRQWVPSLAAYLFLPHCPCKESHFSYRYGKLKFSDWTTGLWGLDDRHIREANRAHVALPGGGFIDFWGRDESRPAPRPSGDAYTDCLSPFDDHPDATLASAFTVASHSFASGVGSHIIDDVGCP